MKNSAALQDIDCLCESSEGGILLDWAGLGAAGSRRCCGALCGQEIESRYVMRGHLIIVRDKNGIITY